MFGVASSLAHAQSHSNGGRCASPAFSLPGGSYVGTQSVALSVTGGAQIRYTVDGSTPTAASTLYTAPISVTAGTTQIRAIALKGGANPSQVARATYVIS